MLAATVLPVISGPAHAVNCPSSFSGFPNGSISSVSAGESRWYFSDPTGTITFHVLPLVGDTDLYVYNTSCGLVGSSAAGSLADDTVTVGAGHYYIEARYFSSAIGVSYYLARAT